MDRRIRIEEKPNVRFDKYLVNLLNVSRTFLKQKFENNEVYVNDQLVKKQNHQVKIGDLVLIKNFDKKFEQAEFYLNSWNQPLEIIYEDEFLLIINKPSGILTHPSSFQEQTTIANQIKFYFESLKINDFNDSIRPGIVNRLDKDTSGLLLIAKSKKVLDELIKIIKEQKVIRKYYAIVHNCFNELSSFKIRTLLGFSYNKQLRMVVENPKNPKEAITILRPIKNINQKLAFVECELITGRTHQIRAHMQYINHPVFNDPIYSNNKNPTDYGQYLHCYYLEFNHPFKKEIVKISMVMPDEFLKVMKEDDNEI